MTTILRRAGYVVDKAAGGREALEKIGATEYAAILLDLMMPEVSGFDVLTSLHSRGEGPRCVIIMSAAAPDALAKAYTLKVFAGLRKPFDVVELTTTVRACIDQQVDNPLATALSA